MRKRVPLLALVAVAALAASALIAPSAMAAKTTKISIGDNFFSPSKKSIKRKGKVKWTWKGTSLHNVTLVSAPSKVKQSSYSDYSQGAQTTGTFSKRFKISGKYTFECTIHPGMELKLKVSKNT